MPLQTLQRIQTIGRSVWVSLCGSTVMLTVIDIVHDAAGATPVLDPGLLSAASLTALRPPHATPRTLWAPSPRGADRFAAPPPFPHPPLPPIRSIGHFDSTGP